MGKTIISPQQFTRLQFTPLTVSCSLVCMSADSPCLQEYDVDGNEYEPDRRLSPTYILPEVRVIDDDKVFVHGNGNEYLDLDSLSWKVNGKSLAESGWEESRDYDIVKTATDTRGMLVIKRNVSPEEVFELEFSGKMVDWRTGLVYEMRSNTLVLATTEKGVDMFSAMVSYGRIQYDPMSDPKLLFDYLSAIGEGGDAPAASGKDYLQKIECRLVKGSTPVGSLPVGVTMQVVDAVTNMAIEPGVDHPELVAVNYPYITLDLRLIDKASFRIEFIRNYSMIAQEQIDVERISRAELDGFVGRGTDIPVRQGEYFNYAVITDGGREIAHPEIFLDIQWHTQARNAAGTDWDGIKDWQSGPEMECAVDDIGLTHKVGNSYFRVWFDAELREKCELTADENGEVLVDENNQYLID